MEGTTRQPQSNKKRKNICQLTPGTYSHPQEAGSSGHGLSEDKTLKLKLKLRIHIPENRSSVSTKVMRLEIQKLRIKRN